MTALAEASIQITLVCRCSSFNDQYAPETAFREMAYDAFWKHGIPMALQQRVVRMKETA